MTRKMMDELYEELNRIGITFTEKESRFAPKMVIGLDDFSVSGPLRNVDGDVFTMERMAEVLAIAEKKAAFLFVKAGETYGKPTLAVCFMQRGLFETIYSVRPITGSLQRNFWYVQEDAKAMALHAILKRFTLAVDKFLTYSHGVHSLYSDSAAIRDMIYRNEALFKKEEIATYMDSDSCRGDVELLHGVLTCLRLAC